jgi:hypothetical protein
MRKRTEEFPLRELTAAMVIGAVWALFGLTLAFDGVASGAAADVSVAPPSSDGVGAASASCRVFNQLADGSTNVGSGTLIDVKASRDRGLVLTCNHLFTEGVVRVLVQFTDGRTHGALVAAQDAQADLAALEICNPAAAPVTTASPMDSSAGLLACGFGPNGEYRCTAGRLLGYTEQPSQVSLKMSGAVRSGDSGGGVFDDQGRLTAVVWGQSDGVTYASTGQPFERFLARVLPQKERVVAAKPILSGTVCPNGRCPLLGKGVVAAAPAARSPAASDSGAPRMAPSAPAAHPPCSCGCGDRLKEIASLVDGLKESKQDRGDYALRSDLAPLAKSDDVNALEAQRQQQHESLLNRLDQLPGMLGGAGKAAGVLATTALGIGGPVGWAIIAASSVGGWFIGRRIKRRRNRATSNLEQHQGDEESVSSDSRSESISEATAAAETSFPIERDDREARELLRLSQLEGRDPLQDALAGRLALDRLDALAESDRDSPHATWADQLRRELRDQFNVIAPAKMQVRNADFGMR